MRLRLLRPLAAVAILLLALVASPAIGAPDHPVGPPSPDYPGGPPAGIVPPRSDAAKSAAGGNNLVYHNGPVQHSNTVYAIYWAPSGYSYSDLNYASNINTYFADVAHDSGLKSNVYYSDTQYSGISYSSIVGNSITDTRDFPASGCNNYTVNGVMTTNCLTDSQLRAEIENVRSAQKWPTGNGDIYFIFTPQNVGSCYSGSSCAFTYYCAYHSYYNPSAGVTVDYANMPYAMTSPSGCSVGQSPNGDPASDATINLISHEHNETITDPNVNAWYDHRGYENGDKCVWTFGTALGGTNGSLFNQVINGHNYYLQQEWSNHSSGCVLTGT